MVGKDTVTWGRAVSLTIRDEETCRLARELAALTGETPADAIAGAVRERMERQREAGERLERLTAVWREIQDEIREQRRKQGRPLEDGEELSLAIGDILYDEHGLPK